MLEVRQMNQNVNSSTISHKSLLSIQEVKKYFRVRGRVLSSRHHEVKAIDGVSLNIHKGETLGLVGESGSGKSTMGRMIMRLETPTEGRILFDGEDINRLSKGKLKAFRKDVQIIFQDPYSSLNPRKSAGSIIGEAYVVQKMFDREERTGRIEELMKVVGLTPEQMNRYPHEFSGGQRQRIGIARAIALNPRLIIADEPVSALDVSIQAQILNLLKDLQKEFSLTYLIISHDLSVVEHMCDRIAVMYLGRIVELAPSATLWEAPLHPYTQALFSAIPAESPKHKKDRILLCGDIPNPIDPPAGCSFHPRCPYRMEICDAVIPPLVLKGRKRFVACHLYNDADDRLKEFQPIQRGKMI